MTTETIEWIACADRLPDTTDFVLTVAIFDGQSYVEPAKRIYGQWTDWMGHPIPAAVTHWCRMPGGPKA